MNKTGTPSIALKEMIQTLDGKLQHLVKQVPPFPPEVTDLQEKILWEVIAVVKETAAIWFEQNPEVHTVQQAELFFFQCLEKAILYHLHKASPKAKALDYFQSYAAAFADSYIKWSPHPGMIHYSQTIINRQAPQVLQADILQWWVFHVLWYLSYREQIEGWVLFQESTWRNSKNGVLVYPHWLNLEQSLFLWRKFYKIREGKMSA